MRLYNSLTRRIEEFIPRRDRQVRMFVCGPTVYDRVHLGNARTFTVFDVVAKWLRHRGYEVTYLQNITDIDDKIIARAGQAGRDPLAYARDHEEQFRADMAALDNTAVSEYVRATDRIDEVKAQIKTLIEKKHVYLIADDGWYFDLTTFPDYGKLSGRTGAAADDAVSRIDDSDKKRHTGDFCVWKLSKPGEPSWEDAELGTGRPGWHIEDTAITEHAFGPQYDLHGGGMDLKFPHHEAEIAQQESASGLVPFVKYWMHVGFLEDKTGKMSKSLGNVLTLHDALGRYDPAVIRFYLLSNHYRAPLDFTDTALQAAQAATQRIGELARKRSISPAMDVTLDGIEEAMDDDMNTAAAFGAVFEIIKEANKRGAVPAQPFFDLLTDVFGIVPATGPAIPDDVRHLVDERQAAREAKDWTTSDRLRDRMSDLDYIVDDTPYGPLIKKK